MRYSDDEYEFLGCLLEGVQGSLSEERSKSRPKNYIRLVKKLRSLNLRYRLPVRSLLDDPSILEKRMAEIAAYNPKVQVNLRITGIGKIQGKNQYKKIKNILLFIETSKLSPWMKLLLEEPFLKLVPTEPVTGVRAELKFLCNIFQLDEVTKRATLEKLYSEHNLEAMCRNGKDLLGQIFYVEFFDTRNPRIAQRRRGYNDKGSTIPDSEKERRNSMKTIAEEIEERRQRILLKQMEIFERNLDKILEISDTDSRGEAKRIIQNLNNELKSTLEEDKENEQSGSLVTSKTEEVR